MVEVAGRVLIAEGDETLRRLLYTKLLDRDIFSDAVANVRHALEKLEEQSYAVVVIDPAAEAESERVLDRIRAIPADQRPVVIVTAASAAALGLNADAVHIVVRKPYSLTQLTELIESCLRRAQATRTPVATPRTARRDEQREN